MLPPPPALAPTLPSIMINFPSPSSLPVVTTATSLPMPPPSQCMSTGIPIREAKWAELTSPFDEACLRRHLWEWIEKDKDWLPIYRYQPVSAISDIWVEWSSGIDGFLPVQDLV